MGYFRSSNGQFANTLDLTLLPAGVRTATASGAAVEVADRGTLRLALAVTAVTGSTPSMTATVETSFDGVTWRSLGTFTAATGVTSERKSFAGCDRFARVSYAISGTTPSFTFAVTGEAV